MINDQFGNTWLVNGGEPASKAISRLRRKRYDYIVLPVALLATGSYVEVPVVEDVTARTRMLDCIEELA